jgi:hypothetical protein
MWKTQILNISAQIKSALTLKKQAEPLLRTNLAAALTAR